MQKMNNTSAGSAVLSMSSAGKPTMPVQGRQPVIEKRIADPSSTFPKGERYPIPSFFEYRIKPRDFDPL